jgi:hypothetical protein
LAALEEDERAHVVGRCAAANDRATTPPPRVPHQDGPVELEPVDEALHELNERRPLVAI